VRAFDELRFGPQRTLNLREGLPNAHEAARRAEAWLREQQVKGAGEVLIITGRGIHSPGGVGIIRQRVEKLLFSLRRRGIIASHQEHNPGAFSVRLAPIRSLVEAPPRKRQAASPSSPASVHGLGANTMDLLRQVAERSLDSLGVSPNDETIHDEMHRFLAAIVKGLPAGMRREEQLRSALRAAIAEYD
jgi:hypothetical protein